MNKQNKQRLESLYRIYSKQRWPTAPDHIRPVPKWSEKNANELTKTVIDFLQLSGMQAERISNEGRVIDNRKTVTDVLGQRRTVGSVKRIKSSMTKGTADISATIFGRSVKIEIKYGKDRQSEAQKKYQADIERAGGIYIIVKEFDKFVEWYDRLLNGEI